MAHCFGESGIKMKVLIPISRRSEIRAEALESILNQTMTVELEYYFNTPDEKLKRKGQFEGYDKIVDRAKQFIRFSIKQPPHPWPHDCVVVNEANAKHTSCYNYELMAKAMFNDANIGAIALWRTYGALQPPNSEHVVNSCVMWRTEILAQMPKLDYPGADYENHCCPKYKDAVESLGYTMKYLDGVKRIERLV
jgi:hypothetical protein